MTAQVREKLILNGVEVAMAFCPELPIAMGYVKETSRQADTAGWPSVLFSTACWRRYIGTWEIKEERLYLNDVIGCYYKPDPAPVFAAWVTAVLRIPEGEVIHPVNMGFGSVRQTELHIKIENGRVVKQRRIDNAAKKVNRVKLAFWNLPGGENRFDGDDF